MTTIDTITTEQIETLRAEAREAGDGDMMTTCDLAIDGDAKALRLVVSVIAYAEGRDDRAEWSKSN